jgi:hypothetical protein
MTPPRGGKEGSGGYRRDDTDNAHDNADERPPESIPH